MNFRSRRGTSSLRVRATATLASTFAIGAAGALLAPAAFAESSPHAVIKDGTLLIQGTHDADAITVGVAADPSLFVVDFGGAAAPAVFRRSAFTAIRVSLGNGNDTFAVNPAGQFHDASLVVSGGRGDDTLRGSDGNDRLLGGRGDDNVDGGRGTDTEILGAGDDTAVWLPGEGNDAVVGGGGFDRLRFVGSAGDETFALTANQSQALLTRNLGNIRMDLDSLEAVDLATLGGSDSVTVGDLSGTDVREANLDLSVAGGPDGQLDRVTVVGTAHADRVAVDTDGSAVDVRGLHAETRISGNDSRDQLQVATGDGNDAVSVSGSAAAGIAVSVDLGAGQL